MSAQKATFFRDRDGHVVVFQAPNPPLWAWVVARVGALVFAHGRPHAGLSFVADAALVTWGYLEVRSGADGFRRVLGALVLVAVVVRSFL